MKYIVYKTTNLKCKFNNINYYYIGVHRIQDINKPDGYIGCGVYTNKISTYINPKTPFQCAVKKYGPNAFKNEILYIYDNEIDAYNKEAEIVNEDFIKLPYVYNVALGGKLPLCINKPYYKFDLKGNLLESFENIYEIMDKYGYSQRQIYYVSTRKHIFDGFIWSSSKKIDYTEYDSNKHGTPKETYLYNIDGKYIKSFYSRKKCAKYVGLTDITKAIKLNQLVQKQFYISDKLYDIFPISARRDLKNTIFYVYKNNQFLIKVKGKELMSVINEYSWARIRDIFRYNQNWYKDYYISFELVDDIPEKKISNCMKVDVYDLNNTYIETVESVKVLKAKYKVQPSYIKNLHLGDRQYKNWIFKKHNK